ncbi:hypothetical protein QE385_001938 [Sphingomonas sp. SORGH_AS 950]|uniref:hypothetical protein n=1 Tax=Sphingomonas sp. SORGH_AS_0950 TaxID=3041792 RepID=UPI0027836866|nr:hypothetical protein [Sphingomonas sp. SORGH_AS_0950]MDQ1157611.1 hypothetical protein [Sphingomonas sp. SORGH_AS_0950]
MLRRPWTLAAATLATLVTPALLGAADPSLPQGRFAQVMIRERVIVRVPRTPMRAMTPTRWKERKGPRCIPAQQLAGALPGEEGTVDIVLAGGNRVRAHLSRACRQIDYYATFYIRPGADGQICARRDPIRTRAGGTCDIQRFRALTPAR